MLLVALPLAAQTAAPPVGVQFAPASPRDGQAVAITWSQTVTGSYRFGKTSAIVKPPSLFGLTYGQQHTVTIYQTATADGSNSESTSHETFLLPYVEGGPYAADLQLTIGTATQTFHLGDFVVAPPCAADASASAAYSWTKPGYELEFDDSVSTLASIGRATIVSIQGNHITVQQPLTFGGIPSPRPSCFSTKLDLGAIAPGTYRLTWIYLESFAPKTGIETPTLTRELTFEAPLPRRRTSRG